MNKGWNILSSNKVLTYDISISSSEVFMLIVKHFHEVDEVSDGLVKGIKSCAVAGDVLVEAEPGAYRLINV